MNRKALMLLLTGMCACTTATSVAPLLGHGLDISKTGVAAQELSTTHKGITELLYEISYKEEITTKKVVYKSLPSDDSETIFTFDENTNILYLPYDDNWFLVPFDEHVGYIKKTDLIDDPYIEYSVPENRLKSWMGYTVFSTKSKQYKLQQYAYTGTYGIRMVDDRYCAAIGTGYYDVRIGDYVDLVLENGTIIPIVVSDVKADCHTDSSNKVTTHDGSAAEFVVDRSALMPAIKRSGNVSSACEEWNSQIVKIRVYNKNAFD